MRGTEKRRKNNISYKKINFSHNFWLVLVCNKKLKFRNWFCE